MKRINSYPKGLDTLQKISVTLMGFLVLLTFVGANLHAMLWQQSSWLVSTVLPAVVVDLTNDERQQLQAPKLSRNPTLDKAAKLKAQHMASNEYFSHYSPSGVSPWYWFDEAGYIYAHAGENLAIHFTDSSEVVEAWMKSPTHRANIVNAKYSEIGVGTAKGSFEGYDTVYVVQLFGTPAFLPSTPAISDSETAPVVDSAELAELTQTLNELAVAVEELTDATEVEIDTEESEVLSESFELENQILESNNDAIVVLDNEVSTEPASDENFTVDTPANPQEVLVVESTISTSSGLAAASITEAPNEKATASIVSVATQPNELLQLMYLLIGALVVALLLFSAVFEARQLHFVQVSYSIGLMVGMGALLYIHELLTAGAVIV